MSVEEARYIAARIPGAKFVELPGDDAHLLGRATPTRSSDEIEEFLTGVRAGMPSPTACSRPCSSPTSSARPSGRRELGDRRWRDLLERHHALVRRELERFRGREVDTAGDGFFATFDGPGAGDPLRARDRRARAGRSGSRSAPGVHTGECELVGDKVAGIAVHIGARVSRRWPGPGEVLVSQTVKDLVAGSGIEFEDRGTRELKGVPGEWRAVRGEVTGPGANLPALSPSIRRRRC